MEKSQFKHGWFCHSPQCSSAEFPNFSMKHVQGFFFLFFFSFMFVTQMDNQNSCLFIEFGVGEENFFFSCIVECRLPKSSRLFRLQIQNKNNKPGRSLINACCWRENVTVQIHIWRLRINLHQITRQDSCPWAQRRRLIVCIFSVVDEVEAHVGDVSLAELIGISHSKDHVCGCWFLQL